MMPISLLNIGEQAIIKRIGGKGEVRQHLQDLGFIAGEKVSVVSRLSDNLIVNVKETRIAIDEKIAKNIFV